MSIHCAFRVFIRVQDVVCRSEMSCFGVVYLYCCFYRFAARFIAGVLDYKIMLDE